ncbi:MAG TPA: AMP-binding protein, partial [Candidatus Binatia bacterium]|nr:AMP-binding protein [Candidatus Binatia bacterium]
MKVYRTEITPLLFLERAEHVYERRIGAIYGRRRLSYGELGTRSRRLAAALAGAGIRRGDRVAFLAPNVPALLDAHFGVALAGAVLVAINTRLNAEEVGYILEHSGSRLLFVDAELARGVTDLRKQTPLVERTITIDDPEFAPGIERTFDGPEYEEFIDVTPATAQWRTSDEEDVYSINYTSG